MPNMFSKGGILLKNRLCLQKRCFSKNKSNSSKKSSLWKTTKRKNMKFPLKRRPIDFTSYLKKAGENCFDNFLYLKENAQLIGF